MPVWLTIPKGVYLDTRGAVLKATVDAVAVTNEQATTGIPGLTDGGFSGVIDGNNTTLTNE
ncbi:hypothetical protein [Gordonia sp. AC31]|uniref:hypothetical protein n=1 Tax=Gordonia sp. AC31 TaxID=2962571 RepID=UPI0028819220|nr:hypothetical protein [Gordonia sp. AC31]MDT0223438.1 hypothetical protein [Gordonia sp. AC31]